MNAIAQQTRLRHEPPHLRVLPAPSTPREPLAPLLVAAAAVSAALVLVLTLIVGQQTGADGPLMDLARTLVLRYGATWVALSGVVLLGLSLVGRPGRTSAGQPAPAPVETGRPQLRLVVTEDPR